MACTSISWRPRPWSRSPKVARTSPSCWTSSDRYGGSSSNRCEAPVSDRDCRDRAGRPDLDLRDLHLHRETENASLAGDSREFRWQRESHRGKPALQQDAAELQRIECGGRG